MSNKTLRFGSMLLACHAIGSLATDGEPRLDVIHGRALAAGGDTGAAAGGDTGAGVGANTGGDIGAGAGAGTDGGFGVGLNTGGGNGFGVSVGGNGVNIGTGGAGADANGGGNTGVSVNGGVGGDAAGAGANGGGFGNGVGGTGNIGDSGAQNSGGAAININGGAGAFGDAGGNSNGDIGGGASASIAWPDLEVGVAPGGNGAPPMYTPAASIWSSPPDSNNAEHTGDHRIAAGMFLTASATQNVPPPQYTIQGGPAKVYYFPPSATAGAGGNAGGSAPQASITPAPARPNDTESSPVGAEIGLGSDGLLTTMGTVLSPGYVYLSFSTLFAGCQVGNEMKTIGPKYSNTMFSFQSDGISTKCASTMAPGATPAYGPPAAVNWKSLNALLETGANSSCWNIAPPAEFLEICPPEWTRQLYWNVDFEPPQMLTQGHAATVAAGAGAAEPGVVTASALATASGLTTAPGLPTAPGLSSATAAPSCTTCSSAVVVPGPTAGATIGSWSTYGGTNGSANGTSNAPFAGAADPAHGSNGALRKAVVGLLVGALTAVALL